ncbi:hypothetical protein [Cochleicola gelatinilyticus]|uniref:Uncharacterized protein n=1 Tax=Cochleicola gelatinilyticus TaxID=1763537 RepID=A0A167J9I4_9FLAO|nr:hypothetical protein [Cochleicola gelatinilyticus]OAB80458.1 hypothetical protein ULVI_06910 [Cochleicola gelatinilyticus]
MKNVTLLLCIVICFVSCKDNPVSEKIRETKQNVSNTSSVVKEMNEMQEDMEDLKEMEPLTNSQLKAWLPKEVDGMKRTGFKAGQMGMMQIASIEATYANEDTSKMFKIELIDGAGTMGAAATAGMRMLFSQEFEEEDAYKTRRTVEKKGVKAIEEYRKNNNNSIIEFLKNRRFYLKATGTNMDLEETWKLIDELDIDNLG